MDGGYQVSHRAGSAKAHASKERWLTSSFFFSSLVVAGLNHDVFVPPRCLEWSMPRTAQLLGACT